MLLPDGSSLMHAGEPYDPAKAHEYYLKYRQLHPRKKGAVVDKGTYTVTTAPGKTVKLSAAQLEEQKVYAAARVAATKTKLSTLAAELRKKIAAEAKAASDAKKGPTAAEKAQAARDDKAYRQKHHQEIATKAKTAAATAPKAKTTAKSSSGTKSGTTTSLRADIIHTKNSLKAEVAKQRELATAKKNG